MSIPVELGDLARALEDLGTSANLEANPAATLLFPV